MAHGLGSHQEFSTVSQTPQEKQLSMLMQWFKYSWLAAAHSGALARLKATIFQSAVLGARSGYLQHQQGIKNSEKPVTYLRSGPANSTKTPILRLFFSFRN